MRKLIIESEVEQVVLDILKDIGYKTIWGPDIACDGAKPERQSFSDVVLINRLKSAIEKINPKIPAEAREEAIKKILRSESPNLVVDNRSFHKMLVEGVDIEYRNNGRIVGDKVWLIDFDDVKNNEFLAVNQFTVIENNLPARGAQAGYNRRPDIVVFINGLPLGVIELKNPADENATVRSAFNQFETYKVQIPSLFRYNEFLVISDGLEAKVGTITSDWERFLPWKTIDGDNIAPRAIPEIEVLLRGMAGKKVVLDLLRHFIVFEKGESDISKKIAAYHQYHAVNKAVESTMKAAKGDKRCGVIWHTQGSGKSLIMVFYAAKLVLSMDNPTVVVLTDRNDLDDQLFGTFSRCQDILRQKPVQVTARGKLRENLAVASEA